MGRQGQQEALTAYDRVPYPGHPFAQTHPDRLATVATLFGLRPAHPSSCRLLELGCGDGGNLVPMAYALPGSGFCGVDLSPRAIEHAAALRDALGLANVELHRADLTALPELGTFDYVVAHGVYSWIAPEARDALLAACRAHLAPGGVAYVSYDVMPGGHVREITRQILRWHLRDIDDPAERITSARGLLQALADTGSEPAAWALAQGDPALYHDELAPHHEAILFTDFVAHARRHGLDFLAEADVFEMQTGGLPDEYAGAGVIAREQYLDFFKGRMFRQTLLCHAGVERREPSGAVVRGMLAATPARPVGAVGPGRVEFRGPRGATITTDHDAVKAALVALGDAWPGAVAVAELDGEAVCEALLRAYAVNLVQLHVWAPAIATTPSERPVASALARLQAAAGSRITNLRHGTIDVPDELGRRLITLLDGTRDRAALLRELDRPAEELERSLEGLARIAVLET
ncbi:MAG TPA: class I SAM-dependent methyltransferase [Solirubrobacteraceae bacterium]|nr:class I SAM-dependent methyltransferase [Solirubrobacteraceae bacterium]